MASRAVLAAFLSLSAIVLCAAACIPSEPHVDCNFHGLSSPKWAELASQTEQLTAAWKAVVAGTPEYPAGRYTGQGLVITATKLDMVNVPTILETLQSQGFDLPVEIWYSGEVSADIIETLSATTRKLVIRNVANYASPADLKSTVTSQGEHVFQAKPLAIINSAFEEVLFMDADNIAVSNPAALFSSAEYQSTGALFWPDFWQTATENPIWSILGVEAQGWEQESGQIVVNKRASWAALNLAFFLAKDATFQQMVNGDKEAFRLAFLATKTPFFMVETAVAVSGSETETGGFCGHTMVQHDLAGAPLFLHHNSLKHGAAISWPVMKSVVAGKSFTVVPLAPATIGAEPVSCLDLTGADIVVANAPFAAFEAAFSRFQSAAHPTLKAVSQNEFVSNVHTTMRRLLQGNGTFTVSIIPITGTCPSGTNPCASSSGGFFTCCSTTCSGQYDGPLAPNDNRALCSTPNGGVDIPPGASPVATTPPPSVQALGLAPVNGQCSNSNFNQPCYAAGAGAPSVCCPAAGFQCAGTDGPSPSCAPLP